MRVLLLCSGPGLLLLAWVFGNPPEAAPDEPAALVKALATGHFELRGRPYTAPLPPYTAPAGLSWIAHTARSYSLPVRQTPQSLSACMAFQQDVTGNCLRQTPATDSKSLIVAATPQGVYPPFLFVPLGLAARWGTSVDRAVYLARLAAAALSGLFIAGAIFIAAGHRSRWSLLGLLLSISPMVVFLSSTVSTNGIEIAAAICFWSALLRLRLAAAPPWIWGALALAGAAMGLARPISPLWLVVGALTFVMLLGPRRSLERIRSGGRISVVSVAVLCAAGILNVAWNLMSPSRSLIGGNGIAPTTQDATELLRQAVGVFGWLDTPLPTSAEWTWLVLLGLLITFALIKASGRERVVLVVTCLGIALVTSAIQMFLITPFGYGMQARYVLPYFVALPLLAGQVIDDHDRREEGALAQQYLVAGLVGVIAWVQLVAFYTNARRYGVGLHSSRSLFSDVAWNPPGGTLLWLSAAAIGCLCIVLAVVPLRPRVLPIRE